MEKKELDYSVTPVPTVFQWRLRTRKSFSIFTHSDDGLMKKGKSYTSFILQGMISTLTPQRQN